jgi:hypothetical protein
MSIKKSLLPSFAAMAIALTAFASSAMAAEDGVLKDVTTGNPITDPAGAPVELHFVGWTKFETLGTGIECHVTALYTPTGTEGKTGDITGFTPITSSCHGFGSIYNGCKITSDSVLNQPYHVTVTKTDFDVTATNIAITNTFSSCVNSNVTFENLFFEEGATLKPLKTGTRTVTDTAGNLGTTAAAGDPIAGVELSAQGVAENNLGEIGIELTGELELTSPERCTYKLA